MFNSMMIRTFSRLRTADSIGRFVQTQQAAARRQFSVKAIHSSFPATLTYYRPKQRSSLFDHVENESRPYDLYHEGVIISKDGLIYPGLEEVDTSKFEFEFTLVVSNGAVMYPNTVLMQEFVRRFHDEALDLEEAGEKVETPQIFTIPKGTQIPSHLILINEHTSRFSLQPSHGISLQDLNQYLDDFFDKCAIKEKAEDWIDKHPWQEALGDNEEAIWMAK